jgi:thioredoxin family protein
MQVEVLIASCCTPKEVQRKIVSIVEGMKTEVPDLTWSLLDITSEPDLVVKYKAPVTPAVYIDGKLEFLGYPKMKELQAKIRKHNGQVATIHS